MKFRCTHCSKSMRVPSRYAGRRGRCTHCQEVVRVPRLAMSSAVAVALERPRTHEEPHEESHDEHSDIKLKVGGVFIMFQASMGALLALLTLFTGAVVPALMTFVGAYAMGRIGQGVFERERFAFCLATLMGVFAIGVNLLLLKTALDGSYTYINGVKVTPGWVLPNAAIVIGLYGMLISHGLRNWRSIDWR